MKKIFIITMLILGFCIGNVYSQLSVLSNGDVFIPGGRSYWIKSSSDVGGRLRLHQSGVTANDVGQVFIDFYPTLRIRSGITDVLNINTAGNVGIKQFASSSYSLSVTGPTYCTAGVWSASDLRLKSNIKPIEGALGKVLNVNGKTYNFKNNLNSVKNGNSLNYGFIAQEVKEIFPDLVQESDDSIKSLAINYDGFIPILVEALKEQQLKINKLEDEISKLKNPNEISSVVLDNQVYILNQNVPNPFNSETLITFSIGGKFLTASINIYNLQGMQIKAYRIEHGLSQIIIEGSELNPGIYLYSLIVDNKIIDTKRMVLIE